MRTGLRNWKLKLKNGTAEEQICYVTIALFTLVTLISLISVNVIQWFGGENPLLIEGNDFLSIRMAYIICFISLGIHITVFISVASKTYNASIVMVSFAISFVTQILDYLWSTPEYIGSTIVPIFVAILIATNKNDLKLTVIRTALLSAYMVLYQPMVSIISTGAFILGYNRTYHNIFISMTIGHTLFLIAIYLVGVTSNAWWRRRKHVLLADCRKDMQSIGESGSYVQQYQNLVGIERVISRIVMYGFQGLVWLAILISCAIFSVFVTGLVFTGAFVAYGLIIKNRPHIKPMWCTISAIAVFTIGSLALPPFKYAPYAPVILGFGLIFTMYNINLYRTSNKKMNDDMQMVIDNLRNK